MTLTIGLSWAVILAAATPLAAVLRGPLLEAWRIHCEREDRA